MTHTSARRLCLRCYIPNTNRNGPIYGLSLGRNRRSHNLGNKLVGLVEIFLVLQSGPLPKVAGILVAVGKLVSAAGIVWEAIPDDSGDGIQIILCGIAKREWPSAHLERWVVSVSVEETLGLCFQSQDE